MTVSDPPGPVNSELDKADLECSICCHDYNWTDKCPRELECLHTFCTECLTRMEGQLADSCHHICCPLCRYSTELTAAGALGLPRQEQILLELPAKPEPRGRPLATLSQQVILTLDSGETTVIMLPTVSLSVEQGDGQREGRGWGLQESPPLLRQNQKQQAVVCLRKASWRLATLLVLTCIAAFVLGPRLF
ncbi:RING finger protein 224 [Mustelus asterias]